jgi:alanyl-tRNA synthetase
MNKSFDSQKEEDVSIFTFIKFVEIQRAKTLKKLENLNSEKENLSRDLAEIQGKNKELLNRLKKAVALVENNEKIKIIESICKDLSLKNVKELPEAIHKFQQVMFALPSVEKFVAEVSEEFVGEFNCKKLEDIVPMIKSLKKQLNDDEEFKKRVFLAFGSDKLKDLVNFGRAISHFCKLFEVTSSENLFGTVEELFYFVRQIKGFVMVIFK